MQFDKVHCLFERSGTFKDVFKKLGYSAFDYDIEETESVDYCVNLFDNIDLYAVYPDNTIFNGISKDDLVMAFFPCTYFSDQSQLLSRGDSYGQKDWLLEGKLEYSAEQMIERANFYRRLCKLCIIAIQRGFKLVIENPDGKAGFLRQYFPIRAGVKVCDRRLLGDYYKKPTQFFFINCSPELGLVSERDRLQFKRNRVEDNKGFSRSVISQKFAEAFVKTWIVD